MSGDGGTGAFERPKGEKVIHELTPEQKALLPVYVEKWTKIALCAEPADRPRAEAGIAMAYRAGGLEPPQRIEWFGSPMAAAVAVDPFLLVGGVRLVEDSVKLAVDARLGYAAQEDVWAALGRQAWKSGVSIVEDVLCSILHQEPNNRTAFNPYRLGGQHDATVTASCDFIGEVLGLRAEVEPMRGIMEVAQSAGCWWPTADVCYVSERMSLVHTKECESGEFRPHCETGPAIAYPDGWSLWYLRGVSVKP